MAPRRAHPPCGSRGRCSSPSTSGAPVAGGPYYSGSLRGPGVEHPCHRRSTTWWSRLGLESSALSAERRRTDPRLALLRRRPANSSRFTLRSTAAAAADDVCPWSATAAGDVVAVAPMAVGGPQLRWRPRPQKKKRPGPSGGRRAREGPPGRPRAPRPRVDLSSGDDRLRRSRVVRRSAPRALGNAQQIGSLLPSPTGSWSPLFARRRLARTRLPGPAFTSPSSDGTGPVAGQPVSAAVGRSSGRSRRRDPRDLRPRARAPVRPYSVFLRPGAPLPPAASRRLLLHEDAAPDATPPGRAPPCFLSRRPASGTECVPCGGPSARAGPTGRGPPVPARRASPPRGPRPPRARRRQAPRLFVRRPSLVDWVRRPPVTSLVKPPG